jgi:hypothetical protein
MMVTETWAAVPEGPKGGKVDKETDAGEGPPAMILPAVRLIESNNSSNSHMHVLSSIDLSEILYYMPVDVNWETISVTEN